MKKLNDYDICSSQDMRDLKDNFPLRAICKAVDVALPIILKSPYAVQTVLAIFPEPGLFPFSKPIEKANGDVCPICGSFDYRQSGTCKTCRTCGYAGSCG